MGASSLVSARASNVKVNEKVKMVCKGEPGVGEGMYNGEGVARVAVQERAGGYQWRGTSSARGFEGGGTLGWEGLPVLRYKGVPGVTTEAV